MGQQTCNIETYHTIESGPLAGSELDVAVNGFYYQPAERMTSDEPGCEAEVIIEAGDFVATLHIDRANGTIETFTPYRWNKGSGLDELVDGIQDRVELELAENRMADEQDAADFAYQCKKEDEFAGIRI